MDSGNSSSMQSSSGGYGGDQEEHDSRSDQSISAFFNHNNTTTVSSGPTQLDSLIANYFNTGWSTDNLLWSTTTTKLTDGSNPRPQPPPPPPPISSEATFFSNPLQQNLTATVLNNTNTSSPICSVPTDKKNGLATTRNPRKRSRVSKRAPTTVLTTDTTNFRAMVQEFTGNPSSPFTASSSFPRSRFDLFGSSSSSSISRPLKPFPHKLIPQWTTNNPYLIHPPSTDYHQNLLLNMNTQNIANPFINSQSPDNPSTDQSLLCEKSRPLFGTSNGFGHLDMGTNFDGLHNIIVSSSSSLTQPTLNIINGANNHEANKDLLRSINGEDHQSMLQRSSGGE